MDDFYLFANCNFVSDRYVNWQVAYDDLTTYVWSSEPTTKTYYFGIPLDYAHEFNKTTSMFAFEVYGKREDLYTTHLASPAMAKFLERIPSASTTGLDQNHYRYIDGFLDFLGDAGEAGIMQDVRISAPSMISPGVLTYTAFAGLDDDVGLRIFGQWESRKDMEFFITREDVAAFWLQNKDGMRSMEQRLYLPNGKGWLHRGYGYAGDKSAREKL